MVAGCRLNVVEDMIVSPEFCSANRTLHAKAKLAANPFSATI